MTSKQAKWIGIYRAHVIDQVPMPLKVHLNYQEIYAPPTKVEFVPLSSLGFKDAGWAEKVFGPLPPVPVFITQGD